MKNSKTKRNYFCIKTIILLFALSLMGLVNMEIAYAAVPNIDVKQVSDPGSITEDGGPVTYQYHITNQGTQTITLDTLSHNIYGDLSGQGTCILAQTIGAGADYQCEIEKNIATNTPTRAITHTVTATASDSSDSTEQTTQSHTQIFEIEDLEGAISVSLKVDQNSRNEPGGIFRFTIFVQNSSKVDLVDIEEITLLAGSQTIDVFTVDQNCEPSAALAVNDFFICTIDHQMLGEPGDQRTYQATVKAKDDDNLSFEVTDSEIVKINNVQSSVMVFKIASPEKQSEPGSVVSFNIAIQNTSQTDVITITSLMDTAHGNLNNTGTCLLPKRLETSSSTKSYTCTYTKTVTGNAGDIESGTVTVTAIDDDGETIDDNDTADVEITDVSSKIFVTKNVQPNSLPEPGGTVTFTVSISNTSLADIVTLQTLNDTRYGDISLLQNSCQLPQTLALKGGYRCTFTVDIGNKNAADDENSFIVASGTDDDNAPVSGQDDAPVYIFDIPSSIALSYDVTPGSVLEGTRDVTFTVEISNTSSVDSVDIMTLTDNVHGNLHGQGTCAIPQTLAIGTGYTCSFVKAITGNGGEQKSHMATAAGQDDDSVAVTDNDTAVVNILNGPPTILVINNVTPSNLSEPGGAINYAVEINNTSTVDPVDIMTLTDSIHGNLHGQGSCVIPQTLAVDQSYSCSFATTIAGVPGDQKTYTVEAYGVDDDQSWASDNDDDTVTISNVPSGILVINTITPGSLPEPGGTITYSVEIRNASAVDSVTIQTLTDSIYGNLDGQGSCAIPQTLAVGQRYICSFIKTVTGAEGTQQAHTVTAQGIDDDQVAVNDNDDATWQITDVPSEIVVTNNISPGAMPEPGGSIIYTVVVRNTSSVDTVTIQTLTDSIYGNLDGQGSCVVPQTLAVGQHYTCSFTKIVTGNAGHQQIHTVTAQGMDDDNKPVSDDDDETVIVTNVASSIDVQKTAATPNINELGANVNFTVVIANTSPVDNVTLATVNDTAHGNITPACLPGGPQLMAPGETVTCTYTRFVGGNAGHMENGTATASGTDDDGQSVSDQDDAPVTIGNIASAIDVTKSANKESVTELGGDVEFVVIVKNVSPVDSITINELDDSIYGNISSFCAPPLSTPLAPGATVTCTFTKPVTGNTGDDQTGIVTAKGVDDDGESVEDSDSTIVKITDLPASIEVVKTASVATVDESGENVTFTVVVKNTSQTDSVNITSINDPDQGNLSTLCTPSLALAPGGTLTCTFAKFVVGGAGAVHNTTAIAVGTGDDGDSVQGSDDAPVTVTDLPSSIEVVKSASTVSVAEDGADVTFTVVIRNTSPVDHVNITSISDPDQNNLGPLCGPALSHSLAPGATTTCIFTKFVAGGPGDVHNTTVSVVGQDDDGNAVQDNDDAPVTVIDVPSSIEVVKTASVANVDELGADVAFTVTIQNSSDVDTVQLSTLNDMAYGDISLLCTPAFSQTLTPNTATTCTFIEFVAGDPGDVVNSAVFATGTDDDGNAVQDNDDEPIQITDTPAFIEVTKSADQTSVPEPGQNVRFTVAVENTSPADHVTIDNVVDSVYGDISTSCVPSLVGQTLAPDQIATCSFTELIAGPVDSSHTSEATVSGTGDDDTPVADSDDATVTVYDLPSAIDVTKSTDLTSVDEAGSDVIFTVEVENSSTVDHVQIDSVIDPMYGDVSNTCQPPLPTILVPGQTINCNFTEFVTGNPGDIIGSLVTATGTDDDGNGVNGTDDAQVEIVDLPSSIEISKSTNKNDVIEPGEDVIFTILVQNTSATDNVTISEMVDSVHGDISALCVPALPATLTPGENMVCTFTEYIGGIAGDFLQSSVRTSGTDDDGNSVGGEDEVIIKVIPSELASFGGLILEPVVELTTTPVTPTPKPSVTPTPRPAPTTPTPIATPVEPTTEPTVVSPNDEPNDEPTEESTVVAPTPESTPEPTPEPTVVSPNDEPNDEPTEESTVVAPTPEPTENLTEVPTVVSPNDPSAEDATVVAPSLDSTPEPTVVSPNDAPTEESTVVAPSLDSTPELTEEPTAIFPNDRPTEESTVAAPTLDSTPGSPSNRIEETATVSPNDEPTGEPTVVASTPASTASPNEEPTVVAPTPDSTDEPAEESNVVSPTDELTEEPTVPTPNPEATSNPTEESSVVDPDPSPTEEATSVPPDDSASEPTVELTSESTDESTPEPTETMFMVGIPITQTPPPTAETTMPEVDLAVTIEIAQEQKRSADPTYVTYKIHYINNGPDAAPNVLLVNTLPEGVVYDSNTMPLESMKMPYLTWSIGTLQPNESGEIYLTLRIMEETIGQEFVNRVNISCDCIESDITDNEDSVSHMVNIPKTSGDTAPSAITLMSFQADPVNVVGGKAIKVRWEISESFNTNGFDLHRGTTMDPTETVKLTPNMISVDSAGGIYSFTDETAQPDVTYIYWLFENEYSSEQNIYGPLQESISSDANVVYLPVVMK